MPQTTSAPLMTVTGSTLVIAPAPRRREARAPGPYGRLFALPGTRAFTAGNLIARLPMGMFGISAVMMIAGQRGSYALAGAVTATGLAATALVAPWTARLVDRYGQARIAVPATVIAVLGSVALILCVRTQAPAWTLFACYAATATTPNIGGMSRARWTHLLRESPAAHHTAMSFEQAADELCYMCGPVVAAFLCSAVFPEAGTLTAAALLLIGMLLFTSQRATEPPVSAPGQGTSPLRAVRPLLVLFVPLGLLFGSMEVTSIAHLDARGLGAATGLVLALQAAGSCAAGLLYGAFRPRSLRTCLIALTAALTLPGRRRPRAPPPGRRPAPGGHGHGPDDGHGDVPHPRGHPGGPPQRGHDPGGHGDPGGHSPGLGRGRHPDRPPGPHDPLRPPGGGGPPGAHRQPDGTTFRYESGTVKWYHYRRSGPCP